MNDRETLEREGQGYPCWPHDIIIIIIIIIYSFESFLHH